MNERYNFETIVKYISDELGCLTDYGPVFAKAMNRLFDLARLGHAVESWPDDYAIDKIRAFDGGVKWQGQSLDPCLDYRDTEMLDSLQAVIERANEERDPTP